MGKSRKLKPTEEIKFNKNEIKNEYNDFTKNSNENILKKIISIDDVNIRIKCLNETQKSLKKSIEEKDIVISIGPAGTGKTFIGLQTALHLMKTNKDYQKLVLVKSVQSIQGEEIGYLKGDMMEKMTPYMYSFTSNLDKIFNSKQTTKMLIDSGVIEYQPIAFCRGITFTNSIVIVDEIQNMTLNTFKTIISRIGEGSKMIFLGDKDQIDLKNLKDSCINTVVELFKDKEYINVIEFSKKESVRHRLIPEILDTIAIAENKDKKN